MDVVHRMRKIPAGLFIIPMILGAIINTFFKGFLSAGGFITAMFKDGTLAIVGITILFSGAIIDLKIFRKSLIRGGILLLTRVILAFVFSIFLFKIFHVNSILGISALAFATAFSMPNAGLFIALAEKYQKDSLVMLPFLSIATSPLIAMLVMGSSGMHMTVMDFVDILFPLVLGMVLGAVDKTFKEFFENGLPAVLLLLAFCLGTTVDLRELYYAGLPGVILAFITVISLSFAGYFTDRWVGGTGFSAVASSSIAGSSLVIPPLLVKIDPSLAPLADQALSQVASAVIVSTIISPIITYFVVKHLRKKEQQHLLSKKK
jgi:2-keto-3-deoxygluconate permease